MSRNARRIALSCGTAVGAALIAASISMGNAPAARADITDADPLSDFIGSFDPTAFDASSGAPTDPLGLFGYYTDTYLLGPSGIGDPLDPTIDTWVGTIVVGPPPATDADPLSDFIAAFDPTAFDASSGAPIDPLGLFGYYTDTYLLGPSGLGDALDPSVDSYVSSLPSGAASVLDADPVSDLIGSLDPSAFNTLGLPTDVLGDLASGLDADLLAPLGLGALLDPVIDGLVGSATPF
ncbi:hypothetical protein [Mycobacterium sp.]|uniref:hypothetical protein n=1 Tax=Mycobacterium sp. TaxID=1785 RepID=UPI003C7227F6